MSLSSACSKLTGADANPISHSTSTWTAWTKSSSPNWTGEDYPDTDGYVASDPTVVKDGSVYHLFYTCFGSEPASPNGISSSICHVTSTDGHNWTFGASVDPSFKGVVFKGRDAAWDEEIETAYVIKENSVFNLYYSGYQREVAGNRPAAKIGLATSANGNNFIRSQNAPILNPTPQGADADDLFSPIVFFVGSVLRMIYTGWCVEGYHDGLSCSATQAIQILGASRNGSGQWIKDSASVLMPRTDIAWMQEGVAEPEMLVGPDGYYYLFATGGLGADEPRITGLARSQSPTGPWEINPEPIVKPSGVRGAFDACGTFAPSVVLDESIVRMWYLGLDDCDGTCSSCHFEVCGCQGKFAIGYAEAQWPLKN